jgi:hypothetical protein
VTVAAKHTRIPVFENIPSSTVYCKYLEYFAPANASESDNAVDINKGSHTDNRPTKILRDRGRHDGLPQRSTSSTVTNQNQSHCCIHTSSIIFSRPVFYGNTHTNATTRSTSFACNPSTHHKHQG